MTDTDLIREPDDWLHLKPFGFAPGNYMSKCSRCGFVVCGLDKRATSCRPCAEAARERLAREDAQPAAVSAQGADAPIEVVRLAAAAQEVHRLGAQCGPQWLRLGTALTLYSVYVAKRAAPPAPEPAEPRVPEVTGEMWSAGRSAFLLWAQRWEDAKTSEQASAIADVAGADILRAMTAAAPPAKPLTEEQIQAERSRRAHAIARGMEPGGRDFDAGVRFAERAHGITAPSAAEGGSNVPLSRARDQVAGA